MTSASNGSNEINPNFKIYLKACADPTFLERGATICSFNEDIMTRMKTVCLGVLFHLDLCDVERFHQDEPIEPKQVINGEEKKTSLDEAKKITRLQENGFLTEALPEAIKTISKVVQREKFCPDFDKSSRSFNLCMQDIASFFREHVIQDFDKLKHSTEFVEKFDQSIKSMIKRLFQKLSNAYLDSIKKHLVVFNATKTDQSLFTKDYETDLDNYVENSKFYVGNFHHLKTTPFLVFDYFGKKAFEADNLVFIKFLMDWTARRDKCTETLEKYWPSIVQNMKAAYEQVLSHVPGPITTAESKIASAVEGKEAKQSKRKAEAAGISSGVNSESGLPEGPARKKARTEGAGAGSGSGSGSGASSGVSQALTVVWAKTTSAKKS